MLDDQWLFSFDGLHYFEVPAGVVPKLSTMEGLKAHWMELAGVALYTWVRLLFRRSFLEGRVEEFECVVAGATLPARADCDCSQCEGQR